jgi:transposase
MTEEFAGIDVSKDWLDMHLLTAGLSQRFENSAEGVSALRQLVEDRPMVRIALESSGGYERLVVAELATAGLPVVVINPRQVRDFAKAIGQLAKTDAIDAGVLARFAQAIRPELRALPNEAEQKLRETLTRRAQLIGMRTMEKNRLQQAHSSSVRKDVQKTISFLEKRLQAIDRELDDLIQASPLWQAKMDLLMSVPGVGQQTARTLIADLSELGNCSRQTIAALVGVAPLNRDSGTLQGHRVTWGGRTAVRNALYMATLSGTRTNPVLRDHYQRLRQSGKKAKVALVACMHKLLTILNAMLRKNEPWRLQTS